MQEKASSRRLNEWISGDTPDEDEIVYCFSGKPELICDGNGHAATFVTVGAVDEETIKRYIESQKWDEDGEGFKLSAAHWGRAEFRMQRHDCSP